MLLHFLRTLLRLHVFFVYQFSSIYFHIPEIHNR
jgi:hypothetical protein